MILKIYRLQCDFCGYHSKAHQEQIGLRESLQQGESGWRVVAHRDGGGVRMRDVCPACAAVTPGAV
jgi:hypothetical protein